MISKNDIYYNKYIKYKTKYLLIGGAPKKEEIKNSFSTVIFST
jgi:hypothetical protein